VATEVERPSPAEPADPDADLADGLRRSLGLSEALVLTVGAAVGVVALTSLVLANAGAHSLVLVVLSSAVLLVGAAVLAWRVPGRPRVVVDAAGLVLAVCVGLVALVLSFPGFPYGIADKDPGLYVAHAQSIAREGDTAVTDEVVADGLPIRTYTTGARFPGIWFDEDQPDQSRPQFYWLYPALLATAADVGGTAGIANTNVALAALAAAVVALSVRRAFGTAAGAAAGVLLATNVLQVWQAKFPTTEMLVQALLVTAVLAGLVSLETRWRPPAAAAGVLLTLTFLARPDGLLLVLGGLAGCAAIWVVRGWDRRLGWFLAGVGATFPYAALQAWSWNRHYSDENSLPTPLVVVALCGTLLVVAIAARAVARPPVVRMLADASSRWGERRLEQVAGGALAAATLGYLLLCWFREDLLGIDYFQYNQDHARTWDEVNLERLSWFLTVPGLLLAFAGVLVLGLRRWRASAWLVVLPMVALAPLYLWSARNSPRLMWWGRRYVPSVLVGIVILMAVALAFAFAYRDRWWPAVRVAAALVLAGIVGVYVSQSLPLRDHRELAGSHAVVADLAALSGDRTGTYLWAYASGTYSAGRDLGSVVWYAHDQRSVLFPEEDQDDVLDDYLEQYPGDPIFVITSGDTPPPPAVAGRLREVEHVQRTLPMWEETLDRRPEAAGVYNVDFTVWEVVAPAAAS
jgi:hypothetical protein